MSVLRRKHVVIVDTGFRRLIYPLDNSFIRDLDVELVDRWTRAGWSIDKTVMLELDHLTIPGYRTPQDVASALFSGMIYAWNAGQYYKVLAFSKGYFKEVDELNVKVDAYHEGLHVRSYENSLVTCSNPLTEEDVARAEVEYVKKTYGQSGFAARGKHVLSTWEKFKRADAVAGTVAILWLREYFEENHTKYSPLAFPISSESELLNRIRKRQYSKMVEPIATLYRAALNLDPSLIFRHCLRSTDKRSNRPDQDTSF